MTGPIPDREPVRVLVVDSDRRVRQSLAGLIGISDGLLLAGAVGDPVGAMHALEGATTDVVLIDPRLPEADVGIALLTEIRRRWPRIRIVALSVVDHLTTLWDEPERLAIVSPASPELLVETLRAIDGRAATETRHRDHDAVRGTMGDARSTGSLMPAMRDLIEDERDRA